MERQERHKQKPTSPRPVGRWVLSAPVSSAVSAQRCVRQSPGTGHLGEVTPGTPSQAAMAGNRGGQCSKPQNFPIWVPNTPLPGTHRCEPQTTTLLPRSWALCSHTNLPLEAPPAPPARATSIQPGRRKPSASQTPSPSRSWILQPETQSLQQAKAQPQGPLCPLLCPNPLPGHLPSILSSEALCPCPLWQKEAPEDLK